MPGPSAARSRVAGTACRYAYGKTTFGRKVATHAWGAGASLMQNVHAGFAAANTCILEIAPDYAGLHSEVIDGGLVMKDGCILPPDRPGLGVVLTDGIKGRYPFQPGTGEFNSVPGKVLST